MSAAPIYVVVSSDDLNAKYRAEELARNPDRKPNPIVFECNADGSLTLEQVQQRAAQCESQGYGACRVGRVVFEGEPGFEVMP
jgi:hypothetical protein